MGPRFESVKVHQWPIGQVVKTAASHAVNIGSNPVWVTKIIPKNLLCIKYLTNEIFDAIILMLSQVARLLI